MNPATVAFNQRISLAGLLLRAGLDAFDLYRQLCDAEGQRLDPCVLDVCLSITGFMNGEDPKPWWHYTAGRKQRSPEC